MTVFGIYLLIMCFIFSVPKEKKKKPDLKLLKGEKYDPDTEFWKEKINLIMTNLICWICNCNLCYKEYKGTKLLDEDGNKPCFECLNEAEALEEEKEEANE